MTYSSIPLSDPRCLTLGRYRDPGEENVYYCPLCGAVLTDENTDENTDGVLVHSECVGSDFFGDLDGD